jgi:vacuolar protein sorting-associated protein 13A/C
MEGAEKGGAAGFAKGVGKGFVGYVRSSFPTVRADVCSLFTKPAVGVMDFLAASTEGIRNTTTVFDQQDIDRVRLPRFIASDGVLRPFSSRDALGQSWLKESYVAHLGESNLFSCGSA